MSLKDCYNLKRGETISCLPYQVSHFPAGWDDDAKLERCDDELRLTSDASALTPRFHYF